MITNSKDPSFVAVEAVPAAAASSSPNRARACSSTMNTDSLEYRRQLILETSSAPRRPYKPLTEQEKKLAVMHRNSVEKRSIVPILYFLAASLGKL